MWANSASRLWLCCAHEPGVAPCCVRIVSRGISAPPETYLAFATWFTIWSIATSRKSPYITSTTGRRPDTAAPSAVPIIADSLIGVSNTRSPNLACSPLVAPNGPFGSATSSPKTMVSGMAASDQASASFTALM